MKKYQSFFLSENFQFLKVTFSIYLNRNVFVMRCFTRETIFMTSFCFPAHHAPSENRSILTGKLFSFIFYCKIK